LKSLTHETFVLQIILGLGDRLDRGREGRILEREVMVRGNIPVIEKN